MAMVNCRECKEVVAADAEKCPKCGASYPNKNLNTFMFVGGTVLILAVILFFTNPSENTMKDKIRDKLNSGKWGLVSDEISGLIFSDAQYHNYAIFSTMTFTNPLSGNQTTIAIGASTIVIPFQLEELLNELIKR